MIKKRILSLLLLSLFVILPARTFQAACGGATGKSTAASQNETQPSTVEGTITFMERDGTVVIEPPGGQRRIVYIQEETKITRNGKSAQFEELKVGDKVSASFDTMRNALEIRASGP